MSSLIFDNVISTVGHTPLIKLNRIAAGLPATVLVKAEFFNPLASVKDRIGKSMIEAGERDGKVKEGSVIIEPTSGNTGIALAFICASRGYKLILTMPDTASVERRILLRMLGAELVLTPGAEGMNGAKGAINKAREILAQHGSRGFMPQQFENPANAEIHRRTTAEEIWTATAGKVDAFVAAVGTGGTFTGVSDVLKSRNKKLKAFAVEPSGSPVLSGGKPGPHKIQGIGTGFIPKNCDVSLIDEVIQVSNEDAFETSRQAALLDGLLGGISTGANIWSALQLAKRPEYAGKTIVTVAPSFGERYLSTPLAEKARAEVTS